MIGQDTVIGQARTLPLRVALADGEAFDSWLRRLAHRNGMPLLRLAPALGFGDRLHVPRNFALTWHLPADLLRRVEAQAGLASLSLDAAVLDRFDPLGWKPIPGSRYCPACLAESGGQWKIRWQLPYVFACAVHRCLLAAVCPTCGRTPHSRLSEHCGTAPLTACTIGTSRHGRSCTGDLLAHRPQHLSVDDPRLIAQRWVDQRLDRTDTGDDTADHTAAVVDLRDFDALAIWLRQRLHSTDLTRFGRETVTAMEELRQHRNVYKRHQPAAALLAAALASHAIAVITSTGDGRGGEGSRSSVAPLLRDVYTQYRGGQRPSTRGPMILSHRRLSSLSPPLQRKLLRHVDGQLPVTERLRYRTRTGTPRPPDPRSTTAADRARHVPQHLWPDWIIRLRPTPGRHPNEYAANLPNALLIPGNPVRNIAATTELSRWRAHCSIVLTDLAAQYPDVLTAICNLADYLDTHGAPIDYRRRRVAFATVELTSSDWRSLCADADTNPGHDARRLHARRHLFTLLTGANLTDRRHPLAVTTANDRDQYQWFEFRMPTALRDVLHRHAEQILAAANIDEPLTWSPPAACVKGLTLPGREPDDIDTATLAHLVLVENMPPQHAARTLGVSIEHLRYAVAHLHQPAPDYPACTAPGSRRLQTRAAEILTADFLHRELAMHGKDVAMLAAETGFSRHMVRLRARQTGAARAARHGKLQDGKIPTPEAHQPRRRGYPIDTAWLRTQLTTLRRTNTKVAAELGLSHETIRRLRNSLGITAGRSGVHGEQLQRYPHLPRDIRQAVEGKRNGWQRLRRFEQVTDFHSINAAAHALGHHAQNLTLQIQRLETDIGAQLLTRGHRYRPIRPTRHGRRLLNQLRRPDIRHLFDQLAPMDTLAEPRTPARPNVG